jgi:hypothetical protein
MVFNVRGFSSGTAKGRSQKSGDRRTDGQPVRLLTPPKSPSGKLKRPPYPRVTP